MKIAYITSSSFLDFDFPLVREYQRQGHEVYVFIDLPCYALRTTLVDIKEQIQKDAILPASDYTEFRVYGDYIDLENVWVVNRTHKSVKNPNNHILYWKVLRCIREIKPDVVHKISEFGELNWPLMFAFRRKLVVTIHDPFPHSGEGSTRRTFWRNRTMSNVRRFVLLNEKQKGEFAATYHLKDEQILINRLGNTDFVPSFVSGRSHTNTRQVLFFGRISPYKGVEYLLEAMKIVHERMPDVKLLLAGGGKFYFDIGSYKELPYIQIINRYVTMPELAGMLEYSTVVVCPYTDATQSGVVQTAYSMNVPVIATNVGGLGESVLDGKTGLLVPPCNPNALADAIMKILADDKLRSGMAERIRKMNDNEFSWEEIARRYVDFYDRSIR